MFMLDKWYLDVVTPRGEVAILYAARLRWGAVRVSYASALEDCRDGAHRESQTVRGVQPPRRDDGALGWRNHALDVEGRWQPDALAIRSTLASTADGAIHWSCHAPRARASVRLGTSTHNGLGYVERLRLTIKPWTLSFNALRWGRHLSDRHALVWIDWRGAERRSWVWLDGEAQPDAVVTDTGVSGLAGGAELCLRDGRDVVDRDVLASVADLLPARVRQLAGPLGTMHEHKRVARSVIVKGGERLDDGWTLHELVTW